MNDTRHEVAALYRERLMALSAEDRFLRGLRMFETAREMVLASMGAGMSDVQMRQCLLRRFYASDLEPEALDKAAEALARKVGGLA